MTLERVKDEKQKQLSQNVDRKPSRPTSETKAALNMRWTST